MELTIAPAFPEPYLQPNRREDCGFYTAAYIARCLGHPDVTAEQVKAWRAETNYHEDRYAPNALGAEFRNFWDVYDDEGERRKYWMGLGGDGWVRDWLNGGWIAHVEVMRIPEMGHAVALLDAADEGVALHDPIYGHVLETWDWFLGSGPGTHGAHHVAGWYRKKGTP